MALAGLRAVMSALVVVQWYPLSSNFQPKSHPTSHPRSHPTSILPSFSHKQTDRAFGHQAGLHRNGRHWDEIEHFQEENTRGAEGHLTIFVGLYVALAGWWYLLMKTAGRSLLKAVWCLIPSFEKMIVCRKREREWLEQQIDASWWSEMNCQTLRMLKTCWICHLQISSRKTCLEVQAGTIYPTAKSHETYDTSHECCVPGAVAKQIRSTCKAQDSPYNMLPKWNVV